MMPATPRGGKRGKTPKLGSLQKRARRKAPASATSESATDVGVVQRRRASRKSRPVVAGSDPDAVRRAQTRSAHGRLASKPPAAQFDAISVAEHIERCRAHVANLTELADVIARTLYELYDYDSGDPELWQCCHLIRRILNQAQSALISLGIVSREARPRDRATEIASGCEAQRQWLRPAVHVIRATIHVLIDVKFDDHDEVLPALRDLESGLLSVVAALEGVGQCCAYQAGRRTRR